MRRAVRFHHGLLAGMLGVLVASVSAQNGVRLGPATSIALNPSGTRVAAGFSDGTIQILDGQMRTVVRQFRGEPGVGVSQLAISPDGRRVAVAYELRGTWRNVRLFDTQSGRELRAMGIGAAAAFSPDGKMIAVGGPGGVVILDANSLQVLQRLDQGGLVLSLAFSPDSQRLAFAQGGAIHIVTTGTWKSGGSVRLSTSDPLVVGFQADGGLVALVARQGKIYRWDRGTGEALPVLQSSLNQPIAGAISAGGAVAGFLGTQSEVEIFELATGTKQPAPSLGRGFGNALALTAETVGVATLEGQVRWVRRPTAHRPHAGGGVADALADAVIRRRPDVLYGTTVQGTPVRVVQVNLNHPGVEIGIEVARGFPTGDESFEALVNRSGATIAATGTFFDTVSLRPVGDLVSGGQLLYRGFVGTALALTPDLEPQMIRVPRGRSLDWSAFDFVLRCGPALVMDGQIDVDPSAEGFGDPSIMGSVPRIGIGFTSDRRLLLVSTGVPLSFRGFAQVFRALGCTHAMNLDAGSSRALFYRGRYIVRPGRRLTNIIAIRVP